MSSEIFEKMDTLNTDNDENFINDILKFVQFLHMYLDICIKGNKFTQDNKVDWPLQENYSYDTFNLVNPKLVEFSACFRNADALILKVCSKVLSLYKDKIIKKEQHVFHQAI